MLNRSNQTVDKPLSINLAKPNQMPNLCPSIWLKPNHGKGLGPSICPNQTKPFKPFKPLSPKV
jgi:hypothetical protein